MDAAGSGLNLWVPETRSPYAAWEYSPIRPPRQSRRTIRAPMAAVTELYQLTAEQVADLRSNLAD